jgi:hypothetical protein
MCLLIGLALVFAAFVSYYLNGPDKGYLKSFDARRVHKEAVATRSELQGVLGRLPTSGSGLTFLTSAYVDACYSTNDDTFQSWQKVCFGRATVFYLSTASPDATQLELNRPFSEMEWSPSAPSPSGASGVVRFCFGNSNEILGANDLSYQPDFMVVKMSSACSYGLDGQEDAGGLVGFGASEMVYSDLTHSVNVPQLFLHPASPLDQSIVAISLERQYFDVPMGFSLLH